MYTNSILAVTGALLSAVAAIPMVAEPHHKHHHIAHKREIVWETAVDEVIVTVPVTKTVWIEPGETPPTYSSQESVAPAAYTPAASSSALAAPAYTPPSSSSVAAPAYTPPASSSAPAAPAYTPPASSSAPAVPAYTPPTTTSVAYVAPTSYAAPTTSSAAAPASSSASSGGSGATHSGDLTYYAPGMGACGWTNSTDQPIIAIAEKLFDSYGTANPNNNPLCGKWISITGKDGSMHKGQVVDRCPGCEEFDLDLSETLFNAATSNGDGRVHNMEWCFDEAV